jgi:hypothetical protein
MLETRIKELLQAVESSNKAGWNLVEMGDGTIGSHENAKAFPSAFKCYDLSDNWSVGPDITNRFLAVQEELAKVSKAEIMLAALYPNGGFIGWHTNENIRLHNLICTWSKSGQGNFKSFENGQIIESSDVAGWKTKKTYWSNKTPIPHAAEAYCDRLTLTFSHKWTTVIDELEEMLTGLSQN